MGFFSSSDHIDRHEFKKALYKLRASGAFSNSEIDEVENLFRGDLNEDGSSSGISKKELRRGIEYLKKYRGNHHLSSEEIEKLEQALKHYL